VQNHADSLRFNTQLEHLFRSVLDPHRGFPLAGWLLRAEHGGDDLGRGLTCIKAFDVSSIGIVRRSGQPWVTISLAQVVHIPYTLVSLFSAVSLKRSPTVEAED
jgi:hypothetical protein